MVTGFGGAFLRVPDPSALYAWYREHLGIEAGGDYFVFPAEKQSGPVVISFFKTTSDYFPAAQPAMLNFQVDDLDATLDKLIAAGVTVDPKRDRSDYGQFGWFTDPAGNRVELWQPPA